MTAWCSHGTITVHPVGEVEHQNRSWSLGTLWWIKHDPTCTGLTEITSYEIVITHQLPGIRHGESPFRASFQPILSASSLGLPGPQEGHHMHHIPRERVTNCRDVQLVICRSVLIKINQTRIALAVLRQFSVVNWVIVMNKWPSRRSVLY